MRLCCTPPLGLLETSYIAFLTGWSQYTSVKHIKTWHSMQHQHGNVSRVVFGGGILIASRSLHVATSIFHCHFLTSNWFPWPAPGTQASLFIYIYVTTCHQLRYRMKTHFSVTWCNKMLAARANFEVTRLVSEMQSLWQPKPWQVCAWDQSSFLHRKGKGMTAQPCEW